MSAVARLFGFGKKQVQPVAQHFPYDIYTNPYRAKKIWPPDFDRLSPKHQFRFERRYKRRAALKWARPTWMKVTKLTQWGAISFVLVWSVLFQDWGDDRAFQGVRKWFWGSLDSVWTTSSLPRPEPRQQVDVQDPKAAAP